MNLPDQSSCRSILTLESVLCQRPDQIATEVDGEVLMMNIDSGKYYGLNEVGSFAWQRLSHPISVRDLCTAIGNQFDVERARCEADIVAFLDGLLKDGLVQLADTVQPTGV